MYIRKEYFLINHPYSNSRTARGVALGSWEGSGVFVSLSCGLHVCVCAYNYHRIRARALCLSISHHPTCRRRFIGGASRWRCGWNTRHSWEPFRSPERAKRKEMALDEEWGNAHQNKIVKNGFQNEATLVMENKKRTRGELVTVATIEVRVFFIHFFCEKCSKMKYEKNRGKCAQKKHFQKQFSKRGHSRNGK